jgi:TetR/AcrR family transcriptional repressor of nem operon
MDTPLKRRGRPPKTERAHPDTREALVRCGVEVLTEQGFNSAGIDGVLARVGVPKGSFYYYFSSKEAFGHAVIDCYAAYFARRLDRCFLDATLPPLARLEAFVEQAKLGMARFDFKRGCLIGNLGQEVSVLPEGYKARLDDILCDWQDRLEVCLETAVAAGDVSATANCKEWAAFFWIGWEGAVLRARLAGNAEPLSIFIRGFLAGLPR